MDSKFMGRFDEVVHTLVNMKARSVTLFLDEKTVVRASKPVSRHTKKFFRSTRSEHLVLTFGKPNYEARLAWKRAKKKAAGKPFPPPMIIKYEPVPKKK